MSDPKPAFACRELDLEQGLLQIAGPDFDFDSFPAVAERLLRQLNATVRERELNADLHLWLIDVAGCRLLLKGEHYAGAMWLEGLSSEAGETLCYLAELLGGRQD